MHMNYVLLVVVLSDPAMVMFYPMDVIFYMSRVDLTMEELSVGITSLRIEILAHCYFRARSSTAKKIILLSLERRSTSAQ